MDTKIKIDLGNEPLPHEFMNALYDFTTTNFEEVTKTNRTNYMSSYKTFLSSLSKAPLKIESKEPSPGCQIQQAFLFQCLDCLYKTKCQDLYLKHLAVHSYPYKCIECNFGSRHRHVVINHFQMNHIGDDYDVTQYFGPITPRIKEEVIIAPLHVETDKSKVYKRGVMECGFCNYTTITESSLKNHVKLHFVTYPYKCNKCSFTAETSFVVFNHYQMNHIAGEWDKGMEASLQCHVCSYLTIDRDAYEEHTLNCYLRKYSCLIRQFTVVKADWYFCNMCDFKAEYTFVLNNHLRMAHEFVQYNEYLSSDYLRAIIVKNEFVTAER